MNSVLLSQLVASTVLAGELSLMAAQVSGDLVKAHEKLGNILFENSQCSSLTMYEKQSELGITK